MATCPRCGGYLGPDHKCEGLWRVRLRYASAATLVALAGVSVVELIIVLFTDRPSPGVLALGVVIGGFLGHAVWTAAR